VAVRPQASAQRARPDGYRTRGHRVPRLGRRPMHRRTTIAEDAATLPPEPAGHRNRLRLHGVPA